MDNRKMQIVIMAGLIVFGGLHIVQTAKAGEAPEIEWQKTYGDQSSIASFNDVVQTSDGGLILLGNQQEKLWLVKTDSLGDELWSKTYEMESNNGPNHGFQVCECSDKGYAIGCVEYANNGYNLILIKTNSNGVELWRKIIYEGLDYWRDYEFQQCFDKGFIFITTFMEVGEDPYYSIPRAILIKTDQNGNTQWIKIYDPYGLKGSTEGHSVKQTDDKGFIFLVTKNEYEHGVTSVDNDIMLVKTDSNGNPLWSEPAGIELSDEGIKLHKTIDNGYVILGRYFGWSAGDPDVLLLIKTDESGQQEWLKYLSMEEILFGYDCIQTQDEGYIITGITGDSNYYSYAYLIKIDKNGEKEWDNIFGNSDVRKNLANSVIQVSDGGFVLAGAIFETESPYSKGWLIKLKPDGDGAPDNEKILDYEKAMYVWGESSDILDNKNDEYNIDELISFCKESEHQINTLYFYVNEDLLNHPNLPTLISKAKENDIEVHALAPGKDYLNLWGGDAPNEYHDNVYLDWVNETINYNSINPNEKFTSIHLDIEVDKITGDKWANHPQSVAENYLDLLNEIMDVVEGQDILISADVGWYYDNENWDFEYQGVTKKLSYHVMNIVDFVTIMDYTDNIDGAKSNISGEMDYAQDNDKDVVIAFETQEPKEGELELGNTFYEEGRHALTNTMDAVWAEYKEFNGFAIHYYDSYKDLQDYPLNGDQDDDDGTIPSVSTDGTPGFELILMVFAVVLFLFWKRKR